MSDAPDVIYLQWIPGYPNKMAELLEFDEVTWCFDEVNEDDIGYVREDIADRRLALLRRTRDDARNHGHCPSCCMEGTGFSLSDWKYQSYVHADGCELDAECNEK